MSYPEQVKSFLWNTISEMAENPWLFARNPNSDFTRKRKLDFENLLRFLISRESGSTNHELLKYFDYESETISVSAFYQQRKKLLPESLQYLLHQLNSKFPFVLYKDKYNLLACDGSEFMIPRNPDDIDTFNPPSGWSSRGFNMIHTISLFDILNKRYLDCVIQPGRKKNEFKAICQIMDRYAYKGTPIFIGDRGFAAYNVYAHAKENGLLFMIRTKDVNIKRLLKMDTLPDILDSKIDIILSHSKSKKNMKRPDLAEQYRYISPGVTFDYVEPKSGDEYPMSLRIVRFEVDNGTFVNIISNLPFNDFSYDEIKHLYSLRWNIEISFRNLKHTIATTYFNSKKVEYIEQEIWARLILFNFCAIVTAHVVIKQKDTKHVYQVNFAMAMKICHHFIRAKGREPPPNVEALIGNYTLPIRFGRNYARNHRYLPLPSFCYRFS